MSDILCVTDRRLCTDFPGQLKRITAGPAKPAAVILREKDLDALSYEQMAREAINLFRQTGTPLILHSFPEVALELDWPAIHLPLHILRELPETMRRRFSVLGASCHSTADAAEAEALGCTYLIAGHVFATSCKPGLPPRGLDFLRQVCQTVHIPVYAIGGITPDNIQSVYAAGARGACLRSGLMTCPDPTGLIQKLERV